ncbi:putative ABC transporter permease [Peptoniphilus sp.]|jgi:uncharacterized membrane protein|uniref:putative ABC transporter permease n=1 Tax=Peptoniphilus sp. TaxID=1971214 RepID=UPI003D8CC587
MKSIELFLIFYIYSFFGWLWESFICSPVELNKIKSRGFLLGPYCPIYGMGATVSYLLLKNINSPIYVFLLSSISSCFLEYIIGTILEKYFHQKWWNYENYPFHINGRVCLYGFMLFGWANLFIVKLLTPGFLIFLSLATYKTLINISAVLYLVLLVDIILTVNHLKGSIYFLDRIYEYFDDKNREYFINLNNSDKLSKLDHFKDSGIVKEKLEIFNDHLKDKEEKIKTYKTQKFLKLKALRFLK